MANYDGKNKHTVKDYKAVSNGEEFGWWKVVSDRPTYMTNDWQPSKYAWVECECQYCGNYRMVRILHLIKGRSSSCCHAPRRPQPECEGW